MGSSTKGWEEWSHPLGALIAEYGYHLLTGAGAGAMTEVAAYTDTPNRDGSSIGIIPTTGYDGTYLAREEFPNPYIEIPIITPLDTKAEKDINPYSRNNVNIMTAHAVIILPGDHGTQNEASLSLFGVRKAYVVVRARGRVHRLPGAVRLN